MAPRRIGPRHDFHTMAMQLLGVEHEKLIYRSQGRDFRLTDVARKTVKPLLVFGEAKAFLLHPQIEITLQLIQRVRRPFNHLTNLAL